MKVAPWSPQPSAVYPPTGLCLGIETSCDETAAALVRGGREVVAHTVASQVEVHRPFGGVVPEIASRRHVERILPVVEKTMAQAGVTLDDVDGVAVTQGPGLVGALLVGISFGKALAFARGLPFIGVNHIEGHIYANFLAHPDLEPPAVCLTVSGGHTALFWVEEFGRYRILGSTRDDAAGEALDKVARVMGLPYPGGPEVDRLAQKGDPHKVRLPRAMMDQGYDFSFSGLKTAALQAWEGGSFSPEDFAAGLLEAVVDVLVAKTVAAAEELGADKILLAGGVAANSRLRARMAEEGQRRGMKVYAPPLWLCTDNAAMIASAGHFRLVKGERSGWDLNARPSLALAAGGA